jgi:2-haloacid dehalogenase
MPSDWRDLMRLGQSGDMTYRAVADHFGLPTAEVRLVAAHAWDVSGALAAGCRAALVQRPGVVASPIGAQPDITGQDIGDIVDQILSVDLG